MVMSSSYAGVPSGHILLTVTERQLLTSALEYKGGNLFYMQCPTFIQSAVALHLRQCLLALSPASAASALAVTCAVGILQALLIKQPLVLVLVCLECAKYCPITSPQAFCDWFCHRGGRTASRKRWRQMNVQAHLQAWVYLSKCTSTGSFTETCQICAWSKSCMRTLVIMG